VNDCWLCDVPEGAVTVDYWDGRAWFMLFVVGVSAMVFLRWWKRGDD
jgi:hypothetical protein